MPRLEARRALQLQLDGLSRRIASDPAFRALDDMNAKALELTTGPRAREAFDLSREPDALKARIDHCQCDEIHPRTGVITGRTGQHGTGDQPFIATKQCAQWYTVKCPSPYQRQGEPGAQQQNGFDGDPITIKQLGDDALARNQHRTQYHHGDVAMASPPSEKWSWNDHSGA